MKLLLTLLLVALSTTANAGPWVAECKTWYGASIDPSERTPENCPSRYWEKDEPLRTPVADGRPNTFAQVNQTVTTNSRPTGAVQIYAPNGGYLVSRSGSTVFITQTSRK